MLKAYQADWVYFCVWSGDYISGGAWNSLDLLKRVYSDGYILTLDEITGWRNGTV
jgi:mannan endo-1,4-beta-mannosidase